MAPTDTLVSASSSGLWRPRRSLRAPSTGRQATSAREVVADMSPTYQSGRARSITIHSVKYLVRTTYEKIVFAKS